MLEKCSLEKCSFLKSCHAPRKLSVAKLFWFVVSFSFGGKRKLTPAVLHIQVTLSSKILLKNNVLLDPPATMIATGNQSLPRFAQAAKYYPEIPPICKKKSLRAPLFGYSTNLISRTLQIAGKGADVEHQNEKFQRYPP